VMGQPPFVPKVRQVLINPPAHCLSLQRRCRVNITVWSSLRLERLSDAHTFEVAIPSHRGD
jgi:hypothetical protein